MVCGSSCRGSYSYMLPLRRSIRTVCLIAHQLVEERKFSPFYRRFSDDFVGRTCFPSLYSNVCLLRKASEKTKKQFSNCIKMSLWVQFDIFRLIELSIPQTHRIETDSMHFAAKSIDLILNLVVKIPFDNIFNIFIKNAENFSFVDNV